MSMPFHARSPKPPASGKLVNIRIIHGLKKSKGRDLLVQGFLKSKFLLPSLCPLIFANPHEPLKPFAKISGLLSGFEKAPICQYGLLKNGDIPYQRQEKISFRNKCC